MEAALGDYWEAYQHLSNLKEREDFMESRALFAFNSGNAELALSLLSKADIDPVKKKLYVSSMLREATGKYKRIRPLIRR
jgi:hypothetical protein